MKKREDMPLNIRDAFPSTPDMCRSAVLHAVSTYREEERRMKKTYVAILAAVLILVLLCGTALALVSYYSVKDSVAGGQSSQAFDENITTLEQTKESQGLTFSLGDAVFDGQHFAAAMNVAAAEGTKPLYIYPTLEGWYDGKKLDMDVTTFAGNTDGFLFPGLDEKGALASGLAVNADVYDEIEGDIQWKIRLTIYEVNWPIETIGLDADGVWRSPSEEALREAFLNEKIIASGHWMDLYASALRVADEEWLRQAPVCAEGESFAEMMVAAGAFTKKDDVEFDFTTALPEPELLAAGDVFHLDEYDVEVKSVSQTFMRVDYELEVRYHAHPGEVESVGAYTTDLNLTFALTDQDGNELRWKNGKYELEDDLTTVRVYGSRERISDEPLTALTFRLDERFTDAEYYEENAGEIVFTVEIEP